MLPCLTLKNNYFKRLRQQVRFNSLYAYSEHRLDGSSQSCTSINHWETGASGGRHVKGNAILWLQKITLKTENTMSTLLLHVAYLQNALQHRRCPLFCHTARLAAQAEHPVCQDAEHKPLGPDGTWTRSFSSQSSSGCLEIHCAELYKREKEPERSPGAAPIAALTAPQPCNYVNEMEKKI